MRQLLLLWGFFFPLFSLLAAGEKENDIRLIKAHFLIGDFEHSLEKSKKYAEQYGEESCFFPWILKNLAHLGREKEMMHQWDLFHQKFPQEAYTADLLEAMCWGILEKGLASSGYTNRLLSLIGAALSQDVLALPFLKKALSDANACLRAVAVELSCFYGDLTLQEEIHSLFYKEKNAEVRLQILAAMGKLRMHAFLPQLAHIFQGESFSVEEKRTALQSLIDLKGTIGKEELQYLIKAPYAELRILACNALVNALLEEEKELLCALLQDKQLDVKASALKALGCFPLKTMTSLPKALEREIESSHPQLRIIASWLLLLTGNERGGEFLKYYLNHKEEEVRLLAAGALAASGSYGRELCLEGLKTAQDPLVRANLALALVTQRQACDRACQELDTFLSHYKEKLVFSQEGYAFPVLRRSHLTHQHAIPNYPEVVNQATRLELLNVLIMMDYPQAQDALKHFLKQRHWGLTGIAAEILLGEGDAAALHLVRDLMEDSDEKVRVEAALVLATWGRDPQALPVLMEAYQEADRTLKIKILEALGRLGDKQSIPFLVERLKDPYFSLRIVAAAVLIQVLKS